MNVEDKKPPQQKWGDVGGLKSYFLEVIRCSRITSFWCEPQRLPLIPAVPFCGPCFRYPVYVPLLSFQLSKSPLLPPICFVSAPTSLYIIHLFLRKINRFIMILEIYGKKLDKGGYYTLYKYELHKLMKIKE